MHRPAALLVVVLAAGCGRGSGEGQPTDAATTAATTSPDRPSATSPATSPETTTAAVASNGCGGAARAGQTEQTEETLEVDGETRRYLLTVPASYDPDVPAPLVFNFHGLGEPADVQSRYSGLDAAGAERGFVVATPQGSGGAVPRWALATVTGSKDALFFDLLRARLEETLCVDRDRVFAAGVSNGGAFAVSLLCNPPHELRAVASVAAILTCRAGHSVTPLVEVHGTADPIVPYEGGTTFDDFASGEGAERPRDTVVPRVPVPPVEETIAAWAADYGCDPDPVDEKVSDDVRRRSYEGCAAPVVLYTVEGGGHTWPGATPVGEHQDTVGPTTASISATDLILDFFARA